MISLVGPLRPGFLAVLLENNKWYLRLTNALWNLIIVAGLINIAILDSRLGLIQLQSNPKRIRSDVLSFGERLCWRESILLKSHWVMVVMDQFTRKIIGFAVYAGDINGVAICCMFNKIQSGKKLPKYFSTDNDPLFKLHRWRANLRILEIDEIKSVPYTPTSHPFIERLIGTIRRELLDRILFWNVNDLQNKLDEFQRYYNNDRAHSSLHRMTPAEKAVGKFADVISIDNYRWESMERGLFQLPVAA